MQRLHLTGAHRILTAITRSSLRDCVSTNRCLCPFTTPCHSVTCETVLARSSHRLPPQQRPSRALNSTSCCFMGHSWFSRWFSTTKTWEGVRSALQFWEYEQRWSFSRHDTIEIVRRRSRYLLSGGTMTSPARRGRAVSWCQPILMTQENSGRALSAKNGKPRIRSGARPQMADALGNPPAKAASDRVKRLHKSKHLHRPYLSGYTDGTCQTSTLSDRLSRYRLHDPSRRGGGCQRRWTHTPDRA